MSLVTVCTAFNPAQAHLVCSRLQAAEFHAEVTHETSALSLDGYAITAGGIRVQVPESEAADATELARSLESSADESSEA